MFPYYETLYHITSIKSNKKFFITKLVVMMVQKLRPDLDIGHNIRALRRAAGLTQEQTLAKMQLMEIQISKSSYAKIETNRMNIKISELVALKQIFNVDFNAFFENLV